ncbi:MAG: phage tail protein [Planctomycetota bacterium]|jgi:hypothetical protein|nr:phage tail protein [Planctomycetota bacterium]
MERKYLWTYTIIGSGALLALIAVGESRLRGQSVDLEMDSVHSARPFYYFSLEIGGQDVGIYEECRGLGSSNDIEEALVETESGVIVRRQTPGALAWHNLRFRRSEPSQLLVWFWRKAMEDGDLEAAVRDGAVTLWGTDRAEPLGRWEFRNAWVASLSFDGSIEAMTIVHEGLTRIDPAWSSPARPIPER